MANDVLAVNVNHVAERSVLDPAVYFYAKNQYQILSLLGHGGDTLRRLLMWGTRLSGSEASFISVLLH